MNHSDIGKDLMTGFKEEKVKSTMNRSKKSSGLGMTVAQK